MVLIYPFGAIKLAPFALARHAPTADGQSSADAQDKMGTKPHISGVTEQSTLIRAHKAH
jgi:hypothetical protein